jgi:hypothetical protein
MKAKNFAKALLAVVAGIVLLAGGVLAQNSPATAAPQLAYGVPQILQLAQAKVSDDTIVAYIHNSGNSYGLNADQIIYLRQQGVSDNVITVMLNQPKAAASPAQSMTQPNNSYAAQASTTYVQPQQAYVQSAPPSTVYVVPDTQAYYYNNYYAQPYYYPYYAWPYPFVSFSFGFDRHFGRDRDGGFRGGFHGGGFRGGNFGSGGFHH